MSSLVDLIVTTPGNCARALDAMRAGIARAHRSTLQLEHDERRAEYMRADIAEQRTAHEAFYSWLGGRIHVSDRDVPASTAELLASRDAHFNDIALSRWDRCDAGIRARAASYGMRSWSLSDTVCVLKQRAREIVARARP
jgi:hypothetical protein